MTPAYEDLVTSAQAAVASESRAAAARAALAAAEAEADVIRDRIRKLDAARAAIVARRAQGDERLTDGPDLAVLVADAEGLRGILAEREVSVAAARAPAEAAETALASARFQLRRAETLAAERALVEHVDSLVERFLGSLGQLAEVGQQLGRGRSAWHPPQVLVDAVHRLHAQTYRGW